MLFLYKNWEKFCKNLEDRQLLSVPAREIGKNPEKYIVLKHDIENKVFKAYKLAEIENRYGHRGTYYVQAYLLNNRKNIKMLKKMANMGHEISYHHDVMDSNYGNLEEALKEFEKNKKKFEENGFVVNTVCQHGNPIVERKGYYSNRDFFRSVKVQETYPNISDIMVNFKSKYDTEYKYYSDSGRNFKLIYDPINNDIIDSDDKNILYKNLEKLLDTIMSESRIIISIHPHRWTKFAVVDILREKIFKFIRSCAKILEQNSFCKRLMNKYYFLAKRI